MYVKLTQQYSRWTRVCHQAPTIVALRNYVSLNVIHNLTMGYSRRPGPQRTANIQKTNSRAMRRRNLPATR